MEENFLIIIICYGIFFGLFIKSWFLAMLLSSLMAFFSCLYVYGLLPFQVDPIIAFLWNCGPAVIAAFIVENIKWIFITLSKILDHFTK